MAHILGDLKTFLDNSPTSFHAARQLSERLAAYDFEPLDEKQAWKLEKGKSYFVMRGGSLCAFTLPSHSLERAMILGSHTDSPALKIKPSPGAFSSHNMTLLGVEVYGGPLLSSWLNRDLAIAGRVVVSDANDDLEERLVILDDAPLTIPQLAIHLDREVNEKGLVLNKQDHLIPLAGLQKEDEDMSLYLEKLLRRRIQFKTLYSYDLFLVPLEPARFMGVDGELLSSFHLDNLTSAHSAVTALLSANKPRSSLSMSIFWDHEEIGSHSWEGAASPFLQDVLKRIGRVYNFDEETFIRLKTNSLFVSIDVSHGLNANYKAKYEPQHLPLLGGGIVIKYNADLKYASTAPTAAVIARTAEAVDLTYQSYVSRSDLKSGSTIGPVVAQQLGIPTVDIGVSLLSMHSIREMIACRDHLDMCTLLTALLQA